MSHFSRRQFLVAGSAALLSSPVMGSMVAANETIQMGLIGSGGRGQQLLPKFVDVPGVVFKSVCDPDPQRANQAADLAVEKGQAHRPEVVTDLRRVIEDPAIDAVVIATPNHWHALAGVWAMNAGKAVYVEKPLAHSLWQSQKLVQTAQQTGKIASGGTQRRSYPVLASTMKRIHDGEFGAIEYAHVVFYRFRPAIGKRTTPLTPPSEMDSNLWFGPAIPTALYRDNWHYDWHWSWNTGNGELGNNGPHFLDIARWALNEPELAPQVFSFGGRLGWDDAGETPNQQVIYYGYKKAPLIVEVRNTPMSWDSKDAGSVNGVRQGVIIKCENATISGLNKLTISDPQGKVMETIGERLTNPHQQNFVQALRANEASLLNCPVHDSHVSCGLTLQGNISERVGGSVSRLGRKTSFEHLQSVVERESFHPVFAQAVDRWKTHATGLGIDVNDPGLEIGVPLRFETGSGQFTGDFAESANRFVKGPEMRAGFQFES